MDSVFKVSWKELKDASKDLRMAGDSNWRVIISLFKLEIWNGECTWIRL